MLSNLYLKYTSWLRLRFQKSRFSEERSYTDYLYKVSLAQMKRLENIYSTLTSLHNVYYLLDRVLEQTAIS